MREGQKVRRNKNLAAGGYRNQGLVSQRVTINRTIDINRSSKGNHVLRKLAINRHPLWNEAQKSPQHSCHVFERIYDMWLWSRIPGNDNRFILRPLSSPTWHASSCNDSIYVPPSLNYFGRHDAECTWLECNFRRKHMKSFIAKRIKRHFWNFWGKGTIV